jgi:hypothetical protein
MRIIGAVYLFQFIATAIVRAPIQTLAPAGTLDQAAAGEPLAKFLVDTWLAFGIEMGVIGVALISFAKAPQRATGLVWAVLGIELLKGPVYDIYMLMEGYDTTTFAVWIVVHTVIIVSGLVALKKARPMTTQA